MSAPTSAAGDGSPAPGYYPDPSIPGYVRYWNGAAWVPGSSRPAPPGTEAVADPAASPTAPPSVVETGPVFFDEEFAEDVRQEPASAWQADAARQAGYGGDHDHRVSWGAVDPRVPAQASPTGDSPAAASELSAAPPTGLPGAGSRPVAPAASFPAPAAGQGPVPQDPQGEADAALRAMRRGVAPERGAGHGRETAEAGGAQTPLTPREAPQQPGQSVDSTAAIRALAAARRAKDQDDAEADGHTDRGEGTMSIRAAPGAAQPREGERRTAGDGARETQEPGKREPGRRRGRGKDKNPAAPAPRAEQNPAASARLAAPAPPAAPTGPAGDRRNPPGFGAPAGFGAPPGPAAPVGADRQGPAAPWAQQVHQLAQSPAAPAGQGPAPAGGEPPVVPWKPPREDPFQAAARAQADVRPAGLGKRFLARLVDSVVLGAIVGAAAVPLAGRARTHIDAKIQAAKLTGRTVTVYLLDSTTIGYLGGVLAALLIAGVLYEALPTARWGRTLGKKICGLQVRDIGSFDTPGFGRALVRWLLYSVLGLVVVGVLNVAWCLFDRPWRQCWHDKAAHTFVAGRAR